MPQFRENIESIQNSKTGSFSLLSAVRRKNSFNFSTAIDLLRNSETNLKSKTIER